MTFHIVDRRENDSGKNDRNRHRFLERVKKHAQEAVRKAIKERKIEDLYGGEKVIVPGEGISEPSFRHGKGGKSDTVFVGNKPMAFGPAQYLMGPRGAQPVIGYSQLRRVLGDPSMAAATVDTWSDLSGSFNHQAPHSVINAFDEGDVIKKPSGSGSDGGQPGRGASPDGDTEDDFVFSIDKDEFLDLFFEDLDLPDMVKKTMKETTQWRLKRAGFIMEGNPANLDIRRSMKNALGRRIALGRPKDNEIVKLQEEAFLLEKIVNPSQEQIDRLLWLQARIEELVRKRRRVPWADNRDLRYRQFTKFQVPNTKAVMFCLMDVSGSMGQYEKDVAKRFFMLLHLFLQRRYDKIEIVFIRHTHEAQEVDEQEFFYGRHSGGTIVSTALDLTVDIIRKRYPLTEWNIYCAQATDGDSWGNDAYECVEIMNDYLMPLVQYYAYVEIANSFSFWFSRDADQKSHLWHCLQAVQDKWANFSRKRITEPKEIWTVFRELFERKGSERKAA